MRSNKRAKRFNIIFFFLISLSLTLSCTPAQKQICVTKLQISSCKNVALNVSSEPIEVGQSRQPDISAPTAALAAAAHIIGVIPLLFAVGIEASAESSADSKLTKEIEKDYTGLKINKVLGDYFIEEVDKKKLFKISYGNVEDYDELSAKGYNSLLELQIKEILLTGKNDRFKLLIKVVGRMTVLEDKNVIWNKVVTVMNSDEYSINEYKNDGGKLLKNKLNASCRKIAYRLSSDLYYSE